jgi:hypothetical protein
MLLEDDEFEALDDEGIKDAADALVAEIEWFFEAMTGD